MKVRLHHVYFVALVAWVLLLVPTVTAWKDSVPFLVFLSWYANFTTDLNNWMTARMKEKAEKAEKA